MESLSSEKKGIALDILEDILSATGLKRVRCLQTPNTHLTFFVNFFQG